ncbi:MAG: hypothetical protein M3345_02330 [Actinomycetota bacterium]|nr:hypothetical protein [Actinomycetota bacterium]
MRAGSKKAALAVSVGLVAAALLAPTSATSQAAPIPELTAAEVLSLGQIDAPPSGVGLLLHADFPAENPVTFDGLPLHSITVDLAPDGTVTTKSFVAAASATGAGADGPTGECSDPTFSPTGPSWEAGSLPIKWAYKLRSTPGGVKPWRAIKALRRAHKAWPQTLTTCNNVDTNEFAFSYLGERNRSVGYDGLNVVDFGQLGSQALAVNYTWYANMKIIEVDLRFNKFAYRWTALDTVGYRYQIRNVATHELGHQLGLDDLSDPHGELTMFSRIGKGDLDKTTLGKGDLKGASLLSP